MTSQLRLASLVVLALWSTCLLQGTLGVGLHSRGSGQFRYNKTDVSREGKVLSLFNIVKFKNSACQSIDPINGPTGTGCLQYHTGEIGRFTTFNFLPTNDNHLANQEQEPGFCCIEYSVCPDPFSFTLDIDDKSDFDTKCQSDDYIFIDGGQGFCANGNVPSAAPNKFCGNMLNPFNSGPNVPLCDCTAPFQVGIFTDDDVKEEGTENPNEKRSRG
ncbi:hypothetical protein TCAL_14480 [Tigriopus californicus]|uniref:CUB domain-containing protein n=1 Tax=Tigriopus californicus TaxID=6832 RepID=A0A553PSS4_TIGCA|nr:hypothetical protein TCAL_14480 [Tigriopus californicus]